MASIKDKLRGDEWMIKELSYNLPGYGFANCFLMGQAVELMELFEDIGVIEKMQNTCQLGTMKYVYPGAHHTRYEYVFTQLMLISNIASTEIANRNTELSLSANLHEYDQLGCEISGGALMQCLAILSNAGYMYDTFTADRILLRLLGESKEQRTDFYRIYKRNLPTNMRKVFDEILVQGNYYKLHLFHIIHILQSQCRSSRNKKLCEICIHIISQLIDPALIKNEATERIFFLYKKIRKIAYLSVDMIYTPASFGANLSRMIYSIATYIDDLFDESSAMNKSIQQLEEIIHQQIYDSPLCILNTTRIEQECYRCYKDAAAKVEDVFQLRDFLREQERFYEFHSTSQPKAIRGMERKATVLLSKPWDGDADKYCLSSEALLAQKLPLTKIAFGTQLAQNLKRLYVAYGLISLDSIQRDSQAIIAHAIASQLYGEDNAIALLKLAIQSLYKYGDFYFNITAPKGFSILDCVFVMSGSKKMSKAIRKKFTKENVRDNDQLHEIMSCADFLESLDYSGTILCFVGGIKACRYKKTAKVDELDGFVYLPNRALTDDYAYIIEAKNYSGGEQDAAKQLDETKTYLCANINKTITPQNRYAYMAISLGK